MKEKFGMDGGNSLALPLRTRRSQGMPGATNRSLQYEDEAYLANIRTRPDWRSDSLGGFSQEDYSAPLFSSTGNLNQIGTTGTARALIVIPRGGYLVGADLVTEDGLVIDGTNYITVTLVNKLGAGAGAIAMLAVAAGNSTFTGGQTLVAKAPFALTLSATAASLNVATGDVVEAIVTVTGTLGGVIDGPRIRLKFASVPKTLIPRYARITGSPLVGPVANVANGPLIIQLNAAADAQVAGVDLGDQVIIPGTKGATFACWITPSAFTTAQRAVIGLASAYNATFNSVALNAWFRLEASLVLLAETDDATTDRDAQSTGKTLVAATPVLLRIDMRDIGAVKFHVDERKVATLAMAALAATPLQPVIYLQKDSGAGVPSLNFEWIRAAWDRF